MIYLLFNIHSPFFRFSYVLMGFVYLLRCHTLNVLMTGIKILLWVNCYGRLSSMFGLAGTPRQGQRHSMSQTTGAIKGKTDLQCD